MRTLFLLLIFPAITFAQKNKTIFLESGSTIYTPFMKNSRNIAYTSYDCVGDGNSNFNYTYKTTPGFYIKAGLEIGQKTSKRFNVTVPVSIGYKEFNTEVIKSGSSYGWLAYFNGTETTKTTSGYGSVMIGPKFNFNFKKFTFFSALNMNIDLFLNSKRTITANEEYVKVISEDFKVESLKVDDISFNSSLQIGADYRLTEHFQMGVSIDAYFSRLNNMMDKNGPYFFNYNYGKRSSIINGGVKLGYNF